ncbi:MAG: hypothetical protein CR997_06345 [Acidobacteria bacterium]|nr:MAG: hypothetical protein CR997_06345 [Acidobacteriota bacterium]
MEILVADDDKTTLKIVSKNLSKWGHSVVCCRDGREAWDILSKKDRPRLAVLDWNMPRLDGVEVCKRIRSIDEDFDYVYLFLLTGRKSKSDIIKGLSAGADDYITKPFNKSEFRTRINTVIRILKLQNSAQREIEQRRKAEKELEKLNQTLEDRVLERTAEVNKLLNQKNRFINQLGHDLKTPLTPMTALLPIVLNKTEDPAMRRMLTLIDENAGYIKNLVDKTIELANLNSNKYSLKKELVSPSSFLQTIIQSLHIEAKKKRISIEFIEKDSVCIEIDVVLMREVIDNLVSNAIKFTPDNGTIQIVLSRSPEGVSVDIKDNGIGIEQENLSSIFDEFYKVDSSRSDRASCGLGLSISKRIVAEHGGNIVASSEGLGKGTTVSIMLPGKVCV